MFENGFELFVEANGRRIPEYGHRGKTHIEGRRGYNYQIKFRNSRAERVLVIPSVDGLNTIDGNPASPNGPGYAVQGYSSLTISGWRTSTSEVRKFDFRDKSSSMAGKTVGQQNCGFIGVQVYAEKYVPPAHVIYVNAPNWPPPPPSPWPPTPPTPVPPWWPTTVCKSAVTWSSGGMSGQYTADLGNVTNSGLSSGAQLINCCQTLGASSAPPTSAPEFNLGTGWGDAATDQVTMVNFERGLWLATMEIYYSDKEGLMKDGINVDKAPELVTTGYPQGFSGFCKPPPA